MVDAIPSRDQPEQLPGPLFCNVVMHLPCSVPLAQRDSPTLTQTSPEKMWTTLQHGNSCQEHSDWSTSSNCCQLSGGTTGGMALVAVLLVALRSTLLTGGIPLARPCSNVIDTNAVSNIATRASKTQPSRKMNSCGREPPVPQPC